jgi:hypothetical protein
VIKLRVCEALTLYQRKSNERITRFLWFSGGILAAIDAKIRHLTRRLQEKDGAMPDEQRTANNSQTYVANAEEFQFETVQQQNGQATVIRFRLADPQYHAGDVLVVLSGSEIHFHGMIGQVADGWAIASDTRGSLLAATVQ